MTATAPRITPNEQCDVVMKGGITSGVVYPRALRVLGTKYRLRGVGGASAGAIGAALGAAAEFGRATGGFETLDGLPDELRDGKLSRLFQPQRTTRPLFGLMLVATGSDRAGPPRTGLAKMFALPWHTAKAFPVAGLIGLAPGILMIVVGILHGGWAGALLIVAGVIVGLVGWLIAVCLRLYRLFTVHLPKNRFGICSGLGAGPDNPGFTDWLSGRIDAIAGLPESVAPLTFGQLWKGPDNSGTAAARSIDLRLITTCLTEGRPYELPISARRFFFDPVEWRSLFPPYVIDALLAAPDAQAVEPGGDAAGDPDEWNWETAQAKAQGYVRLPDAEHLPVIVATRLSLSFPLLIAAVSLYTIDRRDPANRHAVRYYESDPSATLKFSRVWFTDGGLCSNFPVYLFDAALTSRPTFAINLGSFPSDEVPDADQTRNVEWARSNNDGVLPTLTDIAPTGLKAVTGFASAALNTARNWQDNSYLDHPGYRDRIVRVLQTKREGGMNLNMDTSTITQLAERGSAAAGVMVDQFNEAHYAHGRTGWDNHRWVRYRALMSVLPDWAASFKRGFDVLDTDPSKPPSYAMTVRERELAATITKSLTELVDTIANADPGAVAGLTKTPRPIGRLRRIPQI